MTWWSLNPCPQAFQGFHFGGNVGYGFGSVTSITPVGTTTNTSITSNVRVKGFDGGLNVGYTHRFGNFGLSIEGVFNWANSKDRTTVQSLDNDNVATLTNIQIKLNQSIQLRANLSYVICNLVSPKVILGWDNSEWTRSINLNSGEGFSLSAASKKRYNAFLWGAGVVSYLPNILLLGSNTREQSQIKRPSNLLALI